jgi:uncharacterized protein (DUF58 family)
MSRASLLGLVVVTGFFAFVNGVQLAFVVVYASVLVVLVSLFWSWWTARCLSFTREAPGGEQMAGGLLAQRFTVSNGSGLPIPLLEVRDLSGFPGRRLSKGLAVGAHQNVVWEDQVRLLARGLYELGPTEVRLADPFGLFPRTIRFASQGNLLVYPFIHQLPDLAAGGIRTGMSSDRGRRQRDLPPSAAGVREHDPADGINRIHWISTARQGRLMSRTFDAEDGADLLVVLDLRRGQGQGHGPESPLEYAITLAASVAHGALSHGRSVALMATDRRSTTIISANGVQQQRLIMETLALAQADGQVSLADALAQRLPRWRARGNVVVVTSDASGGWISALAAGSQPGQRAAAIFVDPGSFAARPSLARVPAQWRLVVDIWVVRCGDDLSRLDPLRGLAVV